MDNDMERNLIVNQLGSDRSQDFMKENIECFTKCLDTSRTLRKDGNELYYVKTCNDQQMEKIFKIYTQSIAYAPHDSEDLALAYGNRSALLHRMNKHKESVLDIDRALALSKSDLSVKVRLLCRKVECLAVLGSSDSKKVYDEAVCLLPKIVNESNNNDSILKNINKAKNALSMLNKIKTPKNEEIPEHMAILSKKEIENPFDSVAVQYNEQFGKHLAAARDIKPGEIIFVEKLYVRCLNINNHSFYCSYCFMKSWANIPCDCCNWCMFCSEECKNLAWMSYHDIECATVSYLIHNHEFDYYDHLSLRSLLKGIKESGGISNFKADLQSVDKWIDNNGILRSSGFKGVYAATQCSNIPTRFLRKCVINSAIILIILSKYTSFFGSNLKFKDTKDLLENEDVLFIGSVFLKLRKSSILSTHIINKENTPCKFLNDVRTCKLNNCCSKGACLTPVNFYINNSCNPNVKKCITDDQKLIVFALQPIKRNDQLFMAYMQTFYELERQLRHSLVRQRMDFSCDCEACAENWPTITEMYKMPKAKPLLYTQTYNQMESDLFDENNALVKPILNGHNRARFNYATMKKLVEAMDKALKYLEQPSIVICELQICLGIVFEELYCSELSR